MIRKLLVISDIHIRTFKRHDEYNEQFEKFYKMAIDEKPDRIVITGDLVHQKIQMSPELIDMVQSFLLRCSNIAKTIVLIGNHDFLTNNTERLDALSPVINTMNNPNIQYFKRSECVEDENVVWVPISLMDDNKVPETFNPKEKIEGKTYIGLFHSPLSGIETDLGFSFGDVYPLSNFDGMEICLSGDIHKHQLIQKSDPLIIMVGSMIQQNFGESISNHGVVILDIETKDWRLVELPNEYGYYQFKIKDVDALENGDEELLNS